METQDMLNENEIRSNLNTQWNAKEIHYYKETDSTNIRAKELAKAGAVHGTLVVAEGQTQGRGRLGRVWESPKGEAVYMTTLLKPQIQPTEASMLTLVMALSLARTFQDLYGLRADEQGIQIKWPNDIVLKKKKITGILTEMSADIEKIHYVIIGSGINVNNRKIQEDLQEKATSLFLGTGRRLNRSQVIARAMEYFEQDYQKFMEHHDLTFLKEDYEKFLVNKDTEVRVLDPKGEYTGIARGINDKGELLIEKDGRIITVYAGEVSVRGMYGYV
jgi:BirA family biotin operon repressor/biotin-[acetyl-CoA-carboxylase] ligase